MRAGALGLAACAAAGLPAYAVAVPDLGALSSLERGRWLVTPGDKREKPRSLCLGDPAQLAQLQHGNGRCSREIVQSGPGGATIQYSCGARGYGHTRVRVETPRIARIDTQGIIDGKPFSWRGEARRVGAC